MLSDRQKRIWGPTGLLLLLLAVSGLVLYWFSGDQVNWIAYLVMMVFYGFVFWIGAYAATMRNAENTEGIMVASRALRSGSLPGQWAPPGLTAATSTERRNIPRQRA